MFIKPYQLRNLKRKFAAYTGAGAGVLALKEGKRMKRIMAIKPSTKKKRTKVSVSSNRGTVGRRIVRSKKKGVKSSKFTRSITKTVRKAIQEQDSSISIYRKNRFGECRIRNLVDGAGVKGIVNNFGKVDTPNLGVDARPYEFVYFNQLKYADAIAVCYNGKSTTGNWTDTTSNFGKSVKTRVAYASARLVLKNQSQFAFDVAFHIFTCKSNTSVSPLESYKTQKVVMTNISGNYSEFKNGIRMEWGAKLEDIELPDYSRKTVRYRNVIPGQELVWSDVVSDYFYDEQKLLQGNADTVRFTKGCKVLLIEFIPGMNSIHGTREGVTPAASSTSSRGHPGTSTYTEYFGIHESEYYKVVQPEETDDANEGHKIKMFTDTDLKSIAVSSVVQKFLSNPTINEHNGHLA